MLNPVVKQFERRTDPPECRDYASRCGGNACAILTRVNTSNWYARILKVWWPLAASWLLMGIEGPAISATVARLANPEINLAAYGGIVYPLALIIEAPIIMLLAASVALCRDRASYRRVFAFMLYSAVGLTALHILTAFTPLYDLVVRTLLGAPAEIVEPGRIGLRLMTPWTAAIAYRRFQQGVMIRYGHSEAVGWGTLVRLLTLFAGLVLGYALGGVGIVVAGAAEAAAVVSEALYAGLRVRPILNTQLPAQSEGEPLTWPRFFNFYIPLALTSLLSLVWNPIGSAALSRMRQPIESLAVFPVVTGLVFMLRSPGMAYNEVVVALMDKPGSYQPLRRLTAGMAAAVSLLHLLVAATPLAAFWFSRVTALSPELTAIARTGLWLLLPLPGLTVLQSWFQGSILYGGKTRGVPESILAFLVTVLVLLGVGVNFVPAIGLYIGLTAFSLANFAQTGWLWLRSRPVLRQADARDRAISPAGQIG